MIWMEWLLKHRHFIYDALWGVEENQPIPHQPPASFETKTPNQQPQKNPSRAFPLPRLSAYGFVPRKTPRDRHEEPQRIPLFEAMSNRFVTTKKKEAKEKNSVNHPPKQKKDRPLKQASYVE